jgi:hypothetical protein
VTSNRDRQVFSPPRPLRSSIGHPGCSQRFPLTNFADVRSSHTSAWFSLLPQRHCHLLYYIVPNSLGPRGVVVSSRSSICTAILGRIAILTSRVSEHYLVIRDTKLISETANVARPVSPCKKHTDRPGCSARPLVAGFDFRCRVCLFSHVQVFAAPYRPMNRIFSLHSSTPKQFREFHHDH